MLFFVACHMVLPRFVYSYYAFTLKSLCILLKNCIMQYFHRLCCILFGALDFFENKLCNTLPNYIFYQEIIKGLPRHLKIVDLSAVCSEHTLDLSKHDVGY